MTTFGHASVRTGTIIGVGSVPVEVEVDVGPGLPSFHIVGLPDAAVQEARERVRSAVRAAGFNLPNARVVISLAPGPVRKRGTGFDLPIAMGILAATRQLQPHVTDGVFAVGELGLDGAIRSVTGTLAHAVTAKDSGCRFLTSNSVDAAVHVAPVHRLRFLSELREGLPRPVDRCADDPPEHGVHLDFGDVHGQESAIRSLLIAACGELNVLLIGPPGSGKTMLASRLPSILPALSRDQRLSTALVHSVCGLDDAPALAGVRPFRCPHHSATIAGLIGGGSPPRPGEVSLAHNGVLFLDELSEFGPGALQCLRQPIESGVITLIRAEGRLVLPARFALVGASNPCPCGYLGDEARECRCTQSVVDGYRHRVGGPLMDRIDIVQRVSRPAPESLIRGHGSTGSAELRHQVASTLSFQRSIGRCSASSLSGAELLAACRLGSATSTLESIAAAYHLSGRGITRLLRVARTIADIESSDNVNDEHLDEALAYRGEGLR